MPITRTPIIDDDGSGTSGTVIDNAWKQEFYNQIDAFAGAPKTAWTPADWSGANLVLTIDAAWACRIQSAVIIVAHVTYPVTAHGGAAVLGGFPYPARGSSSGFYTTYPPDRMFFLDVNQSAINILNPTTGAAFTNAALSGASMRFAGVYFTD
jgi:hypothetical protein